MCFSFLSSSSPMHSPTCILSHHSITHQSIPHQLNDDYYECLTKETTIALLEACKKGAPPKVGELIMQSGVWCVEC